MATIIDSLLVTLGLDSSNFEKNQKKVDDGLKKTKKSIKDSSKEITQENKKQDQSFKDSAKSALQFFGIIATVAAAKKFVGDSIQVNTQLSLMSKNLGVNIGELAKWSNAAELAGGTAEGMQTTIRNISKAITGSTYGKPNEAFLNFLSAIKVDLVDITTGKAKEYPQLLLDINEGIGKLQDSAGRANAFNLATEAGITEDSFNVLAKNRKELERLLEVAKKTANQTEENGEQWEQATERINSYWQSLKNVGRTIVIETLPVLEALGFTIGKTIKAFFNFDPKEAAKNGGFIAEIKDYWDQKLGPKSFDKKAGIEDLNKNNKSTPSPSNTQDVNDPVKFFMGKGLKKDDATALSANFHGESNLDPNALNPNGINYGIGQWGKPRQEDYKKWSGKDIHGSSLQEQLEFAWYELQHKEAKALKAIQEAQGLPNKVVAAKDKYERPGENAIEAARRIRIAQGISGASNSAMNAGAGAAASSNNSKVAGNTSNKSVDVNIGEIKILTNATDAPGIADSIRPAMNYLLVGSADNGLS